MFLPIFAFAEGEVVDAQVVQREGLAATPESKLNPAATVADARADQDIITVLVNKAADETQRQDEFLTYSLNITQNVEQETYTYEIQETEEKIPAGTALEVESVFVAKELLARLRDEDFTRQHAHLKRLLNANTNEDYQKLLFGTGGAIDNFRGLLEVGRDATDVDMMDESRIANHLGVTDKNLKEKEIFATGYLKTRDNKLVKIEDVLNSGVEFDPAKGRASLTRATAFLLLKEAISKVETAEDKEKLGEEELTSAMCLAECSFSGNIGDSLSELVKLTAYQHSPLVGIYCLLKEFSELCHGTGETASRLTAQLEKYQAEIPEGYDCKVAPVTEREPTGEEVEETTGEPEAEESKIVEGVEIIVERKSRSKDDKYIRYKASLEGDKAEETKSQGKFFWVCQAEGEEDAEKDGCKNVDGGTSVTYEDLKKDVDFEVKVFFKTEKDGDELVSPVSFRVTFECDSEEEDCEEEEDENDRPYTWEDFYNTGIPEDNWQPPPRAQPLILPPRRGMTVTPAVP